MTQVTPIRIAYFSDVLCIWSYAAQIRVDELVHHFGDQIQMQYHFIPVFGDLETKISRDWQGKGGIEGMNQAAHKVAAMFPHLQVHPQIWQVNLPRSSCGVHVFLKAVQLLEQQGVISAQGLVDWGGKSPFEACSWALRLAFFRDGMDIGCWDAQIRVANALNLPIHAIQSVIQDGSAMAATCRDMELQTQFKVEGSPTYILNEGRQKLYGNIGYKVLAANVEEILSRPSNQATWC